ncbi:hypothetical protein CRE_23083 [Caenorhabditis remanei]|uniref:F-box domain-containing protein n=1 Tax=Caenorhabditis remanei TaxID=31234 RepID=E3N9E7_CAERE|nr:hypothetical protein CRE_23083 [Caenorhabditis remanei]
MKPTFPLFRLPENVVVHVLESMDIGELFIISLVSSKTKNLVSSLGLEANYVNISISRSIRSSVRLGRNYLMLDFYKDSNDQNELLPTDITLPVAAYVGYKIPTIQSSTPFNFSNWLNHIKTVFCCNQPPKFHFAPGWETFGIESLKEAIGSVKKLVLETSLTNDSSRKLLKHFNSPSELFLERNPFEDACQTQQILIQNFEFIGFNDPFSLDDMLLINSKMVESYHKISQTQFNRFVKHWIRGSNPRLQYMSLLIDMGDFVNGEVYLKGIRCMEMSEDAKTEIREKYDLTTYVDMIQIRRKDGTTAAIGSLEDDVLYVHFIVLH